MNALIVTPRSQADLSFLKHVLSSLKEVEIVSEKKLTAKEIEHQRVLAELKEALQEAKDIEAGRKKSMPLSDLIQELRDENRD